jgi:Cu(I)/Ag(I) efflux system membrane protein CusA/SilA
VPLGGYTQQFQINVDPNRLKAYEIPIGLVVEAVCSGNNDTGGRLIEFSGAEYMVHGRGYIRNRRDIGRVGTRST